MPPARASRQSSRQTVTRRNDSDEEADRDDGEGDVSRRSARPAPRATYGQRRRGGAAPASPSSSRRRATAGYDDDEAKSRAARERNQARQHTSLAASQGSDDGGEDRDDDDDDDDDNDDAGDNTPDVQGDPAGAMPLQVEVWKQRLADMPCLPVTDRARNIAASMGRHEMKLRANDLVRMALFMHHRNTPIRREDITKKVLNKVGGKDYGPAFPVVFNRAQRTLRCTFGYEMIELRARGADNEQIVRAQTQTQSARRAGQEQAETQPARKGTGSKAWILHSVLPAKVIARMNAPQENLEAIVTRPSLDWVNKPRDPKGILLDWKYSGSELGTMGLLFLVLGMILVSGRTLSDGSLRAYLRRMSLDPSDPLPSPLQPHRGSDFRHHGKFTVEEWLDELVRHAYLERIRSGLGAHSTTASHQATLESRRTQARGTSSRAKRRSGGGDDEAIDDIDWRWGARAEAEITEKAVALFVADIFLNQEQTSASDAPRRATAAAASSGVNQQEEEAMTEEDRRKKRREHVLREIERVAGSQLIQ